MLQHPTVDKLHQLRLTGMARALAEQAQIPDIQALTFEERLGLLVEREADERHNRQTSTRLRRAPAARLAHGDCDSLLGLRLLLVLLLVRLRLCLWIIRIQRV